MKNYLSMKTLTDFRKTAETGVDPRLLLFILLIIITIIHPLTSR